MNDNCSEKMATIKRLGTMLCSIGTLVSFAYSIGGVGGYLFGQGRPLVAAAGLAAGALFAWSALLLWKSYLADAEALNERDKRRADSARKS